uniref:Calx-beta domain-containing protein n=1 Tax=Tetranychus urticae TaxID=32264 RepID=T1KPR5_TETUR
MGMPNSNSNLNHWDKLIIKHEDKSPLHLDIRIQCYPSHPQFMMKNDRLLTIKPPSSFSSASLTSSLLVSSAVETADVSSSSAEAPDSPSSKPSSTVYLHTNRTSSVHRLACKDGLVLPAWRPMENLSTGDVIVRGLVYFFCLVYLFVGVSIVADKFMAAIEVITSQERDVRIKKANGEYQVISVRIWNETVSNLTLMALGSSAPEILLSIIEVYAQNYEAGDLGPGTIVGSAAFNMFVIIAVCVWVVPTGEVKKIKHLRVFFVTMVWSVFAYIWLFIILSVISPGIVDLWEAFLTFAFFPATVLTAWIADRRLLIYKYLSKNYRMNKRGVIVQGEGDAEDVELGDKILSNHVDLSGDAASQSTHLTSGVHSHGMFRVFDDDEDINEETKEFEEHRREFISILRELRKKHPDAQMEDIEHMAREEIINRGPKSRAFYRLQATKKLTGGSAMVKRRVEKVEDKKDGTQKKLESVIKVFFDPAHYTVMENVGQFAVTVAREGDLSKSIAVDFATEDGTANAGSDYIGVNETIVFQPNETSKQVMISVIDDDVFEEDEHFYCRLNWPKLQLGTPPTATVMILDDDHSGVFAFKEASIEIPESVGPYLLQVSRVSGARGQVILPYKTIEGSAKGERDFIMKEGELIFENNETCKEIEVQIIDNESYEKDAVFYVELGEPIWDVETDLPESPKSNLSRQEKEVALLGRPKLGEVWRVEIRIKESKEFKNTVDKLFQKNTTSFVGSSCWWDQFVEAITVSPGDDDGGDEDGEQRMPSCSDYVMHFITLFWKVLFALVPPTDIWGGWACFITSIVLIGALTAVIGDCASHFGCSVGLKDAITAISFVALGTSVPDTFASKVAAINDKYADSSIGNVTGSNAVNVFLGIGIAWFIAAAHHTYHGRKFYVEPGNLAFSVTLFCICAGVCCIVLGLRRWVIIGGELGGPLSWKLVTTILFIGLWLFYVLMSSLEAYGIKTY